MTSAWETHAKLPVGWRYGGWMKVDNEPLDIEPINATPWGNPGGSINLVAYRASPFSVKVRTTEENTTERKLTYDACPYGFTLDQGWYHHYVIKKLIAYILGIPMRLTNVCMTLVIADM
ncbi:hypothetical protein [Faucicola atlantae]|uniref:hypothetical protein n=1 Tax=Faucicola atlantae TaxID=34059 RepID=UPI0025B24325|nr:hypothetical protein [Moraxella atlantae]